jgi:homoserine dehydrogenase
VPSGVVWTDDIETVLSSDTDVVVELIGGIDPATDWIRRSLQARKSVVTANKQVIAHHGPELIALSAEQKVHLCFEAAVAGGIPIVHGVREGLAGDSLTQILGILNGTCNYILTRMESDKVTFSEALREAKALGYAEADPTADVDGFDAQAKIAILSAVAFGRQISVSDIPLQTIRTIESVDFLYADRLGCTIRQVARADADSSVGDGVRVSVQPTLVPRSSALARVEGGRNVVVVEGAFGGESVFSGFGAGGDPTGVAVVSDLEAIARGPGDIQSYRSVEPAAVVRDFVAPHYLRFVVTDRPGIIAALANVFSAHGVNINAVLQEPGWSSTELPFVVTLEACESSTVEQILKTSAAFDFNVRAPLWLPVLVLEEGRQ